MRALVLIAITGCSVPDKFLIDAGVADDAAVDAALDAAPDAPGAFSCLGQPNPTMAPANLTMSGTTRRLVDQTGIAANLTGYRLTGMAVVSLASDATGNFSITFPTFGMPLDGYVLVSAPPLLDTYLYPAAPIATDTDYTVYLASPPVLQNVAQLGGVTYDPLRASVLLAVTDCNRVPLAGATITTTTAGPSIRYMVNNVPNAAATATDATGAAWIFNATPGTFQVGATVAGMILRTHSIQARVNTLTITQVKP